MQRYILTLAYKGTNFHGWQQQPNAKTIQGEVKRVLEILFHHKVCIFGAGRTDTGVHASFYVAHFDKIGAKITEKQKFIKSVNALLPDDIVIYDLIETNKEFHARFSAVSRTYKYFINTVPNPFIREFSYYFKFPLNIELMNQAAEIIKQYDDFKSFEKLHSNNKTSICKITEAKWKKKDNQLIFTITADRFLRNMVRSIVGTMIDIGRGKITIDDFCEIIETKDRQAAGTSAKAHGLFLVDIKYSSEIDELLEKSRKNLIFFYQ